MQLIRTYIMTVLLQLIMIYGVLPPPLYPHWRPLLCHYLCVHTCPCMGVNAVLSFQQQNKLHTKVLFLSPVACCTEFLFL